MTSRHRLLLASFVFFSAALTGPATSYGQVKGTQAGSAEAKQRIQEYKDSIAKDQLTLASLKVGRKFTPSRVDAKVIQVIDADSMLVGLDDARTGKGNYPIVVMLKCPTKGIVDGKHWRGGQWKEVTGATVFEVTETTTYKTADGTYKTVFVIEPKMEKDAVPDKKAVDELRDEVLAAAAAAKEMMDKARLPPAVKNYVIEVVNGKKAPRLSAADLKTSKEVMTRDEVKKWIDAEHKYVTARDKK